MDKKELSKSDQLFVKIAGLLNEARKFIVKNVTQTIVYTCYEMGKLIDDEEQEGKERAEC